MECLGQKDLDTVCTWSLSKVQAFDHPRRKNHRKLKLHGHAGDPKVSSNEGFGVIAYVSLRQPTQFAATAVVRQAACCNYCDDQYNPGKPE